MSQTIETLLNQLLASGQLDPAILSEIGRAAADPVAAAAMIERLKALAGHQAEETLNIADFYEEKDGRPFVLLWPICSSNPAAGIDFEMLDRKTQFFVLFSEWQNRELEGMGALLRGDTEAAQAIFEECLERAEQLDVGELCARTCSDLARVAETLGDQDAVRDWTARAVAARRR